MNTSAQHHDKIPCFDHASSMNKINRIFDFSKESIKILDLGCGDGRLSKELVNLGHEVHGIDSSKAGLEIATQNGIKPIEADLEQRLPIENDSFDLVLLLDVLEHLHSQKEILTEIKRILKPEGHLIITYPNQFDLRNRLHMLFGGGIVHWDHKKYSNAKAWQYGHIRFLLYKELLELLDIVGLYPKKVQFNFMAGGLIPTKLTPEFLRKGLLKHFPQLFTGKYTVLASKKKCEIDNYIYISKTTKGM